MSFSEEILCGIGIAVAEMERERKKKRKSIWMKEFFKKRATFTHHNMLDEISVSSPNYLCNFLRMNATVFDELLALVGPVIKKNDTEMRAAIPVEQRLSITLRYLATGNSFEDLKFSSAVSSCCIGKIVFETCEAIIQMLKSYIQLPQNEEEWKLVANQFNVKWSFPNCIGAVDGKHIAIKKPPNSGSLFYNYKKFYSVVLMALVNANYEFLMVDVGINGRISDGGVLRQTPFGKAFYANKLKLPLPGPLPNSERILPYVFVGDDAFQLTENFLKPFAQVGLSNEQRVFNYRLSRARRIVENAFGILSSRFGVLQRPLNVSVEKVNTIVLACCYLHNFLRSKNYTDYMCSGDNLQEGCVMEVSSTVRDTFANLQSTQSRNASQVAKTVREQYLEYFNNEGAVSFQNTATS